MSEASAKPASPQPPMAGAIAYVEAQVVQAIEAQDEAQLKRIAEGLAQIPWPASQAAARQEGANQPVAVRGAKATPGQPHLAILVPSKGRPQALEALVARLQALTLHLGQVTLVVLVGEDDHPSRSFLEAYDPGETGLRLCPLIGEDPPSQGARFERMRAAAQPWATHYLIASDKLNILTPAWDQLLWESIAKQPDPYVLNCFLDSVNQGRFGAFYVMSEAWCQALGRIATDRYPFWYEDAWMNELGQLLGRRVFLDVNVHFETGTTHAMFHLPFWARYHHLLAEEREAWATKLLAQMGLPPEAIAERQAEWAAQREATAMDEADWEAQREQLNEMERLQSGRAQKAQPLPAPEDPYWAMERAARWELLRQVAEEGPKRPWAYSLARFGCVAWGLPGWEGLQKAWAKAQGGPQEGHWVEKMLARYPLWPQGHAAAIAFMRGHGEEAKALAFEAEAREWLPKVPSWQA